MAKISRGARRFAEAERRATIVQVEVPMMYGLSFVAIRFNTMDRPIGFDHAVFENCARTKRSRSKRVSHMTYCREYTLTAHGTIWRPRFRPERIAHALVEFAAGSERSVVAIDGATFAYLRARWPQTGVRLLVAADVVGRLPRTRPARFAVGRALPASAEFAAALGTALTGGWKLKMFVGDRAALSA